MSYPHYHDHFELLYVTEGERILVIGEREEYPLKRDQIALIKPYVPHRTKSGNVPEQQRYLAAFSQETAEQILEFAGRGSVLCCDSPVPVILLDTKEQNKIINLMESWLRWSKEDGKAMEKCILCELLITLSAIVKNQCGQAVVNQSENMVQKIYTIARYMEEHYGEPLYLEQVAKEFYLSPCYLSRCFKQYMGMGIINYLNQIRLTVAQKMLQEQCDSITSIAYTCGFESLTHFERLFKKRMGISPKQYQKEQRSQEKRK